MRYRLLESVDLTTSLGSRRPSAKEYKVIFGVRRIAAF